MRHRVSGSVLAASCLAVPLLLFACGPTAVECAAPEVDCNGACVDLSSNVYNCGGCGTQCLPGQVCSAGLCASYCGTGLSTCNGACRDLNNDPNNCGACGNDCGSGRTCESGLCISSCSSGQVFCGGTCVDPLSDRAHCGASGSCTGSTAGVACATGEVCEGGVCVVSCPAGQLSCNGQCVSPEADPGYCGASGDCQGANAGTVCTAGQVCHGGACAAGCPMGLVACGGRCVDPLYDRRFCGASGNCQGMNAGQACSATDLCSLGVCQASCGAGLSECDGVCRNLLSEVQSCGACDNHCPLVTNATRTCQGGVCGFQCTGGFGDCNLSAQDGCEHDLRQDNFNCGGCGVVCDATKPCRGGVCGGSELTGETYCVATYTTGAIVVLDKTGNGSVVPVRQIAGAATGLSGPWRVMRSSEGELYAANYTTETITVYEENASGDAAPARTISYSGFQDIAGMALDATAGELFVVNRSPAALYVFPANVSGSTTPLRSMSLPTTPNNVYLDAANNELYVLLSGEIRVFAPNATDPNAPLRTLTGLSTPMSVNVDAERDELMIVQSVGNVVVVPRTASGAVTPLRSFSIGVSVGAGLIDAEADEYAFAVSGSSSVRVFPRMSNGTATPVRTLTWTTTGNNAWGIALCP